MASPGQLIKCVASVLGIAEATVIQHDRNLLVAGKRTTAGRGRSAAKIAAGDAANLLIPVAAGVLVKDSLKTWETYVSLPVAGAKAGAWDIDIAPLQGLAPTHSFGEALTTLIEAARDGSLADFRKKHAEAGSEGLSDTVSIRVSLTGPEPDAEIRIEAKGASGSKRYYPPQPTYTDEEEFRRWAAETRRNYGSGDLRTTNEFTQRTIYALGKLLNT